MKTSKPKHFSKFFFKLSFMIWLFTSSLSFALGQDPTDPALDNLRSLQRLSLQITGDLPTVAQEKAVLAGTLSGQEFLQLQKNNPELRRRLGAFWSKQLNIFEPINYLGAVTGYETSYNGNYRDGELWLAIYRARGWALIYGSGPYTGNRVKCPSGLEIYLLAINGLGQDPRTAIPPNGPSDNPCVGYVPVAPYWNPSTKILVPPGALDADTCGPDLRRCIPMDGRYTAGSGGSYINPPDPNNRFIETVNDSVTWEPGLMVANTILSNRPWGEVLTTERGIVNGPFVNFMKNFGEIALLGAPDLTYRSKKGDPLSFPTLDPLDLTSTEIDRGADHSGILTTFAFQSVTNGRRAKAVRARSAFLCEDPVVSKSVKPIASEEKDLTKRPYCSSCHVVIEPMASFFGKWPPAGVGYLFNKSLPDAGSFRGVDGNGAKDFGHILAESTGSALSECAVQRTYEFLLVGAPTAEIRKALWPKLVASYAKGNVWEVMLSITGEQWLWK